MLKDGRPKRNIFRSADFRKFVGKTDSRPSRVEAREFYLASLWETALDHHRGIGALLMFGLSTSALALLRTFIETSYRFIWLQACASEKAVQQITSLADKGFPDLSRIISDLKRKSKLDSFGSIIPQLATLHDFSHAGHITFVRRMIQAKAKEGLFESDALFCISNADSVLAVLAHAFNAEFGTPDHSHEIQHEFENLVNSYESLPNDEKTIDKPSQ